MRQIDLPLQIDHLRQLGDDFAALHATLTGLDVSPGSELLRQLGPKILAVHELVGRTLVRLSHLDGSQYTAVPGSRSSLETISQVVASASVAASQLARAVADNPLDAAVFAGGPRADYTAIRKVRHTEAAPLLAESLTTAAHHLDLCATCCQYTAAGIARELRNNPQHQAAFARLTDAQYTVLDTIAKSEARRYNLRGGGTQIVAGNNKAIHATPFAVLQKHRLIQVGAGTSPLSAQNIKVTAAGKLVLDIQKPRHAHAPAPEQGPKPGKSGSRRP